MGTGREDPPELFCLLATGDGIGLELLQELVSETDAHLFVAEMLVFRRPARKD
jgi:hypothetical protein